jgi:hypothetical protein
MQSIPNALNKKESKIKFVELQQDHLKLIGQSFEVH